ncbi:hypothetical protein SCHPADRAFT_125500 [Schizopora paradoxa]|uniref:Uncharacterized protein n=1 Tax=Schizopora paradoxa TaxID=27342 RepID=A0A0H2SM99_9AGAM|nr:hypothetical protein SCHPADRAFT_125500 [Schizopora paradoxa]
MHSLADDGIARPGSMPASTKGEGGGDRANRQSAGDATSASSQQLGHGRCALRFSPCLGYNHLASVLRGVLVFVIKNRDSLIAIQQWQRFHGIFLRYSHSNHRRPEHLVLRLGSLQKQRWSVRIFNSFQEQRRRVRVFNTLQKQRRRIRIFDALKICARSIW